MKKFIIAVLILHINVCFSQINHTRILTPTPNTPDEHNIINTVKFVYQTKTSEFICFWDSKKISGNFSNKFSPYFTKTIINNLFNTNNCDLVAFARFGGTPIISKSEWNDKKYKTIKIYKPFFLDTIAIVEVRFWKTVPKMGDAPTKIPHGGAVFSLIKENSNWRIANIESVDYVGANGFTSLIKEFPRATKNSWKDIDFSKSLTNPEPYN